jgi:hypothetical protein
MKTKWVVNVIDSFDEDDGTFEISVLKDSNNHGKQSYGWIGTDKILILSDGGPTLVESTHEEFERFYMVAHPDWVKMMRDVVWPKALKMAQEIADELSNAD